MNDLISRQAAIDVLHGYFDGMLDTDTVCPAEIYGLFECIPVAQPERKKGRWIEVEVFPESYDIEGVKTWSSEMQCDQCGFRHTAIEGHMAQYNYCPNCGADMRGEEV